MARKQSPAAPRDTDIEGFKTVAEHLGDPVVITDARGRCRWANAAFTALCGHRLDDLTGHKPGRLLQGSDTNAETVRRIRRRLKNRQPVREEILNYHADGDPYWVHLSISPIRDCAGTVTHFVAFATEISRRKDREHSDERLIVDLYSAIFEGDRATSS